MLDAGGVRGISISIYPLSTPWAFKPNYFQHTGKVEASKPNNETNSKLDTDSLPNRGGVCTIVLLNDKSKFSLAGALCCAPRSWGPASSNPPAPRLCPGGTWVHVHRPRRAHFLSLLRTGTDPGLIFSHFVL